MNRRLQSRMHQRRITRLTLRNSNNSRHAQRIQINRHRRHLRIQRHTQNIPSNRRRQQNSITIPIRIILSITRFSTMTIRLSLIIRTSTRMRRITSRITQITNTMNNNKAPVSINQNRHNHNRIKTPRMTNTSNITISPRLTSLPIKRRLALLQTSQRKTTQLSTTRQRRKNINRRIKISISHNSHRNNLNQTMNISRTNLQRPLRRITSRIQKRHLPTRRGNTRISRVHIRTTRQRTRQNRTQNKRPRISITIIRNIRRHHQPNSLNTIRTSRHTTTNRQRMNIRRKRIRQPQNLIRRHSQTKIQPSRHISTPNSRTTRIINTSLSTLQLPHTTQNMSSMPNTHTNRHRPKIKNQTKHHNIHSTLNIPRQRSNNVRSNHFK